MFIRKVLHKNKKSRKEYSTYKLVDSIRTERGPRQRDVLNLGVDFKLPKERWKDLVLKNKDTLEAHLRWTEGRLFALEEKIILYDLPNTFFEGSGRYNRKARYGGNSKEKRSDCPLVSLGLVLDMQGFLKKSRIFEGNVSEPQTLEMIIKGLASEDIHGGFLLKPTIVVDAGIATEENIQWLKDKSYPYIVVSRKKRKASKISDIYCLRTNRKDLNEQQIWDIYTMLTDIEDAFRCMKSELGLRPIYHRKEARCDGHIFITVIAYHILHTIRFKLQQKGVRFCWATFRKQLSTQVRITTTMKREDNKVIHIRKASKAEPPHQVIYDALNLAHQPGKIVKTIL